MEHEVKKEEASLGKALRFSAAQRQWACEVDKVREIVRSATITALPNSTYMVAGVINVRGEVVPVIDPWPQGRSDSAPNSNKKTVIILQTHDEHIGLRVDHVYSIEDIQAFDLNSSMDSDTASLHEMVSCNVYLADTDSVPLVDVGLILESVRSIGQKEAQETTGQDHALSVAGGIQ